MAQEGMKLGLKHPPACDLLQKAPGTLQPGRANQLIMDVTKRMSQGTSSLMGGENQKSQVLALNEQSCCWEEIVWGSLRAFTGTVKLFTFPWLCLLSWFASPTLAWPRDSHRPRRLAATFIEGAAVQSASEMKNELFALTGINGLYFVLRRAGLGGRGARQVTPKPRD